MSSNREYVLLGTGFVVTKIDNRYLLREELEKHIKPIDLVGIRNVVDMAHSEANQIHNVDSLLYWLDKKNLTSGTDLSYLKKLLVRSGLHYCASQIDQFQNRI